VTVPFFFSLDKKRAILRAVNPALIAISLISTDLFKGISDIALSAFSTFDGIIIST